MTAPITRHQRELCNLAIVVAQQQDTIDGLQRYLKSLHDAKDVLVRREDSLTEERDTLLAENTSLRADIDGLESVIHELIEDRWWKRYHARLDRKLSELYQAQSLEFCQKYEVEEVRANAYRQERDDARQTLGLVRLECERLHEATEDDLRTITKLRRAIRLMLAGASTRDMRRKLKAIAEGVMGK